jgi:hypothetical protein
MVLGRGLNFFYDEWNFVDSRSQSFWSSDLVSHNGHPVVVPFAIYRLAFAVVGIHHYWPYLLLVVMANVLCGWLLFLLLRRKIHPVMAAGAVTVLMLLGPAWQDLLWPFQIGFLGSMAGGLGALILLDRRRPGADGAALACLLVAVFSSGIGITMVAGITVELLWLRRDRVRIWVPLIAAATFTLWDLTKARGSVSVVVPSASNSARFIGQSVAGAVGTLVGRNSTVGSVLAIVIGVFVVTALVNRPSRCGRLAMAVVGGLTFWGLTLVTRGSDPTASRYLYPGVVFVLLAVGELPGLLTPNRRGRPAHSRDRGALAAITGIVLPAIVVVYAGLAIFWNSGQLRAGQGGLLEVAQTTRAELAAVELEGRALSPTFRPDVKYMPQLQTEPYLDAVAAYGSPADAPVSLARQPASVRTAVDAMLLRGLPMRLTPLPASTRPTGSCLESSTARGLEVHLPPTGVWITAAPTGDVRIAVRAYGSSFLPLPRATVLPGQTVRLRWTGGAQQIAWYIALRSTSTPSVNCLPGGPATR